MKKNIPAAEIITDIELRVGSAQAWLDDVKSGSEIDECFGPIGAVLCGKAPANLKALPSRKAKKWRKATLRAEKFEVLDDIL